MNFLKVKPNAKEIDEKGFVFIGNDKKPYWCRMYCGNPWFMYWNNGWVTLKQVTQMEVWDAYFEHISDEDAEKYHRINEANY